MFRLIRSIHAKAQRRGEQIAQCPRKRMLIQQLGTAAVLFGIRKHYPIEVFIAQVAFVFGVHRGSDPAGNEEG